MIARLLRPQPRQRLSAFSRSLLAGAGVVALFALPAHHWVSAAWWLGLASAILPMISTRSLAGAALCLPPVLAAGVVADLQSGPVALLMIAMSMLLLPGAVGVGMASTPAGELRAIDLGCEAALPLSQLLLLLALCVGRQALGEVCAGLALLLLLPSAVSYASDGWSAEGTRRFALPALPPTVRAAWEGLGGPDSRILPIWLDPVSGAAVGGVWPLPAAGPCHAPSCAAARPHRLGTARKRSGLAGRHRRSLTHVPAARAADGPVRGRAGPA